jgi:hypothetical protein
VKAHKKRVALITLPAFCVHRLKDDSSTSGGAGHIADERTAIGRGVVIDRERCACIACHQHTRKKPGASFLTGPPYQTARIPLKNKQRGQNANARNTAGRHAGHPACSQNEAHKEKEKSSTRACGAHNSICPSNYTQLPYHIQSNYDYTPAWSWCHLCYG